jgi:hypothetical protein
MGIEHPSVIVSGRFLRQYNLMFTHLEREIEQVHGGQLGSSLVTYHEQLAWKNYLVVQLYAGEIYNIDPLTSHTACQCWR